MNNTFALYAAKNSVENRNDIIKHHGIKNMRWGERNGPPYPLDSKVSASIKSGHYSHGKSGGKDKKDPHGKKTTVGEKVLARLAPLGLTSVMTGTSFALSFFHGAGLLTSAVLSTPMAALGIGAMGVNEVSNLVAKHREKKVKDIINKSKTDKKTGLKLKNEETSIKEDIKMVNPGFSDLYTNTKHNCALCSATYDMRRRGFNVTSQKAKSGYSDNDIAGFYKNGKFEHIQYDKGLLNIGKNNDKILNKMKSQGVGARGIITVVWNGGGGHALNYEVTSEGPRIIDAQCGKIYNDAKDVIGHSYGYMSMMRTDNLKPNYAVMKEEVVT